MTGLVTGLGLKQNKNFTVCVVYLEHSEVRSAFKSELKLLSFNVPHQLLFFLIHFVAKHISLP